jgi:DNA-binding transcriptional regulator YdaS (Cro superfamily)
MSKEALEEAIEILGGQSAFARAIGVKQGHVYYWVNKKGCIPAEYAIPAEVATNLRVTRNRLRPDLWPIDYRPPCPPAKTASTPNAGS